MKIPTLKEIQDAARVIEPFIHRTPVLTSRAVNAMAGAELYFKCENFQKAGVFKIRGATFAVQSLSDADAARGVATHSSGNHAAALTLAARLRGIKAHVVMPENAPRIKVDAVLGYGGEITYCEPTLAARESTLDEVVARTGAAFIHPYDNATVITGQGTAGLELCEEVPDLDVVMTPVGGGGLLSGTAIAVSGLLPDARIIAGEPAGADDAYQSFQAGKLIPQTDPQTIADGLRTSLSDLTFTIIRTHVNHIWTAGENEIVHAMRTLWERMKIIVEPSSAVPLAALLSRKSELAGCKVGIILSGGNVDLANLPW